MRIRSPARSPARLLLVLNGPAASPTGRSLLPPRSDVVAYLAASGLGGLVMFTDVVAMARPARFKSLLSEAAQVDYCVWSMTKLHQQLGCPLVWCACGFIRWGRLPARALAAASTGPGCSLWLPTHRLAAASICRAVVFARLRQEWGPACTIHEMAPRLLAEFGLLVPAVMVKNAAGIAG